MKKREGIGMRKIRTLCYCILQGVRSVWKNRVYSLASAATISACLLLLGIFYFVAANFNHMVKSAESFIGVTVFFERGTAPERMLAIAEDIKLRTEVSEVIYVSADEAWEKYKKENLNPELIQTFGSDNPLADSASLTVYVNDAARQKMLVRYIESIQEVRKVNHSESIADSFEGIRTIIWLISAGLIAILTAVAVFLIRTTISTGINVRREEISIMSIIGATDFFIRAPFVVEGIVIGALGTMLPIGMLYVLYGKVIATLRAQFETIFQKLNFLDRMEMMQQYVLLALIFGEGLCLFTSYFTSKHQIRKISIH